jgi:sulfur carrier protein
MLFIALFYQAVGGTCDEVPGVATPAFCLMISGIPRPLILNLHGGEPDGSSPVSGLLTLIIKKPLREVILRRMNLILPDRSTRIIDPAPATVEAILKKEGINPLEVMVVRDGLLIPEDTLVGGDDELRIIRISHGG